MLVRGKLVTRGSRRACEAVALSFARNGTEAEVAESIPAAKGKRLETRTILVAKPVVK